MKLFFLKATLVMLILVLVTSPLSITWLHQIAPDWMTANYGNITPLGLTCFLAWIAVFVAAVHICCVISDLP